MICALLKSSGVSDRVQGMIVLHGLTHPEKPHCTLKTCKKDKVTDLEKAHFGSERCVQYKNGEAEDKCFNTIHD